MVQTYIKGNNIIKTNIYISVDPVIGIDKSAWYKNSPRCFRHCPRYQSRLMQNPMRWRMGGEGLSHTCALEYWALVYLWPAERCSRKTSDFPRLNNSFGQHVNNIKFQDYCTSWSSEINRKMPFSSPLMNHLLWCIFVQMAEHWFEQELKIV